MLGPTRQVPRVGAAARVTHFGGGFELAVIVAVADEGRRVRVRLPAGEQLEFALNAATARFIAVEDPSGPRLELLADSQ